MLYAKIDEQNMVMQVILADANFIKDQPGRWVKACPQGKNPKNYPGQGYTWVPEINTFLPPKPRAQCKLDKNYNWGPKRFLELIPGPAIEGTYEEALKDSNGKQLYEKIAEGPNKADVIRRPLVVRGICLDIREN